MTHRNGVHAPKRVMIEPGATASDFAWGSFPVDVVPDMLYQLTKRRKSNEKVWTTEVFLELAKKLGERPRELFTNIDISKLFFGLKPGFG